MNIDTVVNYVNVFEINPAKVFKPVVKEMDPVYQLLEHYEKDSLL